MAGMKSPLGGLMINGTRYPSGAAIPEKYHRQLEPTERRRDPAFGSELGVPNMGRAIVPHVLTFSGLMTGLARTYRYSDEALRHSVANAHMMLNDPMIAGPLLARQHMTALLNWSVESEDEKDPKLKAVANELTNIISRTPRFTEYRRCLLEAIWYGRYGIQNLYGFHSDRDGNRRRVIADWVPISGDKLLFRFDDGSGDYDRDQIGLKVSASMASKDCVGGRRAIEATGEGLAYFLEKWERKLITLHRHYIRDGEFEDPRSGGQVHGVGLRHFLYWIWYQKQEAFAQVAEIVERTGMGFIIYFYPSGNAQARDEVEKISREQAHTNTILMPAEQDDTYRVEQIPPNTSGLQVLLDYIENYLGDLIVRFILGQTLSSKPSATGMNTGVADLQKDSLFHIIRYDAVNLEETLTRELLLPNRDFNFPKYRNVDFFLRISTKVAAPEQELQALQQLWQMGAEIKTADIFDRLDLSLPDEDDQTLFNPQVLAAAKQFKDQLKNPQPPQMGGGAPGAPPAPGGGMPPGAPPSGPPGGGMPPGQGGPPPGPEGGAPPEQMDKEEEEDAEKARLFGPVLYRKVDRAVMVKTISDAVAETDRNPTEAQRESGNYKMGRFYWHGLQIAIETPKGVRRRKEYPPMGGHYGYIKLTKSEADGDHLDVLCGPDPQSELVFCVDQVKEDGKTWDEHKCLLFYTNEAEAKQAYLDSYTSGWKCGPITAMTLDQFLGWLEHGDTGKPIEHQPLKYARKVKSNSGQLSMFGMFDAPAASPQQSPNVGDTQYKDGHVYQFNENHRWEGPVEAGQLPVDEPEAVEEGPPEEVASESAPTVEIEGKKARVAKDGSTWVHAKAGGETSPVNGVFYKGGRWMPIHGLSPKQEKHPKPKPPEGGEMPPAPNEEGEGGGKRGVKQRTPMSPDEIEAERAKRENQAMWTEISTGPLGQIKWFGDKPNTTAVRYGVTNLDKWKRFAEDHGADAIQRLIAVLEPHLHSAIESQYPGESEESLEWAKNSPRREAEFDATMRGSKQHLKSVPDSLYARQLIQHAIEQDSSIKGLHNLNTMIADAITAGSGESEQNPQQHARLRAMVMRYVKDHHPDFYARKKSSAGQTSLFGGDDTHPRAPVGGTTVGGEPFKGGEFIPAAKVAEVAADTGKSKQEVAQEIKQGEDPAFSLQGGVSKAAGKPKPLEIESIKGKQQTMWRGLHTDMPGQRDFIEEAEAKEADAMRAAQAKPPEASKLTFDEFRKQYQSLFQQMMKYKPNEIGSQEFAEKMAALSDQYPEWAEQVENEGAPQQNASVPDIDDDVVHNWGSSYIDKQWSGKLTDSQKADLAKASREHHQKGRDARELAKELKAKWAGEPQQNAKEVIPGGLASGMDPEEFDSLALADGMLVEMEHTDDPRFALEIAADHLRENPDYYRMLAEMEGEDSEDAEQYGKGPRHAPKGGIKIGGKQYVGGMWIPNEAMEAATPAELKELSKRTGEPAEDASEKPKGDSSRGRSDSGEPPVPEGMTRLYHGSAEHGRYEGKAWFSTHRPYAENYRGKESELQYVDMPTDWVNSQVDPDGYGQTVDKGHTLNVELDSSVTGARKPVRTKPKGKFDDLQQRMDDMPEGSKIMGWEKKGDQWTREGTSVDSQKFLAYYAHPVHQHQILGEMEGGPKIDLSGGDNDNEGDEEDEVTPAANNEGDAVSNDEEVVDAEVVGDDRESIRNVAEIFGIQPGDIDNDRRMRLFLTRTARRIGFDPESVGKHPMAQVRASAQFLESQKPKLNAVVNIAKAYGWKGSRAQELAARVGMAGQFIVKQAESRGFRSSGGRDDQADLEGAMEYLVNGEGESGDPDTSHATNILSGKGNYKNLAASAIGFFLSWMLIGGLRRRFMS